MEVCGNVWEKHWYILLIPVHGDKVGDVIVCELCWSEEVRSGRQKG